MGLVISLFQMFFLKLYQRLILFLFTEILSFTKRRFQTSLAEYRDCIMNWDMKIKMKYLVEAYMNS